MSDELNVEKQQVPVVATETVETPFVEKADKPLEEPKPDLVAHESGVAMGREAFETGKRPEGAVSLTALAPDEQK